MTLIKHILFKTAALFLLLTSLCPAQSEEPNKNLAGLETQEQWAKGFDGFRCRLRTDKTKFFSNEIPVLKADIKNADSNDIYAGRSEQLFELYIDGEKYYWPLIDVIITPFPPGSIYNDIVIKMDGRWWKDNKNEPLKLTPGRHSVSVIFNAQKQNPKDIGFVRFGSNELQIEILPITEAELGKENFGWGKDVNGLKVGISVRPEPFVVGGQMPVRFKIQNVGTQDRTIIWHELHYSPVVFEIGKKGGPKTIQEDSRRFNMDDAPSAPEKIVLKPGDFKEDIFYLQYFGFLGTKEPSGTYEITGMYSPKDNKTLKDSWLKDEKYKNVVKDRIVSGTVEISVINKPTE